MAEGEHHCTARKIVLLHKYTKSRATKGPARLKQGWKTRKYSITIINWNITIIIDYLDKGKEEWIITTETQAEEFKCWLKEWEEHKSKLC